MSRYISKRFCKVFSDFHKKFPSGGFLHVVTDDGNWETEHIVWCLIHWRDFCASKEDADWLEEHEKEIIEMCCYILELKEKDRCKIWNEIEKFKEHLTEETKHEGD